MNVIDQTFAAAGTGTAKGLHGTVISLEMLQTLDSGTGDGSITFQVTADPSALVGWTPLATLTTSATGTGTIVTQVVQASWCAIRAVCNSITGTGASLRALVSVA